MAKSTFARSIARTFNTFNEFDDHKVIDKLKVKTAEDLAAAAAKGEYSEFKLNDDEVDMLDMLRTKFDTIASNQEDVDSVFPRAALFMARVTEIHDEKIISALKPESIKMTIDQVNSEMKKMAELAPLRDGETLGDRRKAALARVLASKQIPATDPQGRLALAVWSKVDIGSPMAERQAERLLTKAREAVMEAGRREELRLLMWATSTVEERKQANLQQAEMERRRQALNPGLRKQGLFERMGAAFARGVSGSELPKSWKPAKSGFRQIVTAAADAE